MEITWHGFSCFSIKGKNAVIITDPYPSSSGVKLSRFKADIVLANTDFLFHHALENISKDGENVFDWPGEYEAKGVNIIAIPAFDRPKSETEKGLKANRALLFVFDIDGFKLCHLSNLGHKLTPEMIEAVGDSDILLTPVGGNSLCLDAEKAHEVIEQIDPRVVIPMYYSIPDSKIKLAPLDGFLKEIGVRTPKKEESFKIKTRQELPEEHTDFVILEPVLK